VVVSRNPGYYEADLVKLKRVTFIPISTGSTAVNLYKAGSTDAMDGARLPQEMISLLGKKKDFHYNPAFFTLYTVMNTTRAPFNNPMVRYAFNMATNKNEVADFFGAGRIPAANFIPPLPGYQSTESVVLPIAGRNLNVLSYNPAAARELLGAAGYGDGRKLSIEYLFPTLPHSRPIAEILQNQWRRNLGVNVKLVLQEFRIWAQNIMDVNYTGIAEDGFWP